MAALPKVTDKTIRSRVGQRSFALGREYAQDGAIFDARRQGRTLKTRCQGSRHEAYRVEVTFDGKGITQAVCSCPVGDEGSCKHVAALLVAWRESPHEFREAEQLDQALERRSKEELIALVKQMLYQQPELETLLETPLPGAATRKTAVRPDPYRRQAEAAFRRSGYGWDAANRVAGALVGIQAIGDDFLKRDEFTNAAAVYEGIVSAVLDNYDSISDEEGDLHVVVNDCVAGLGQCLRAGQDNPAQRESILQTLWALHRFDVDHGGISMGDETTDLLLQKTTPAERRTMAGWVREAISQEGQQFHDKWRRQAYGGLLLDLEADTLDDEAYLRICRDMGRRPDLVDRLLKLRRLGEAVRETEQSNDYALLGLADIFVKHHHARVAEQLVHERTGKSKDVRLLEWLKKRAANRHDTAAALDLAQKIFHEQPDLDGYREIRKLAKQLDRWGTLRAELLEWLKKPGDSGVRVQVYLDEGQIDEAIEAVRGECSFDYEFGHNLRLEVAAAAGKNRPRAALEIYRQQAEGLINLRGRANYQTACEFLKKVRDLHKRLGETEAWTKYIAALREQHRSLRALQQELTGSRL